jgi:hypothetical protein
LVEGSNKPCAAGALSRELRRPKPKLLDLPEGQHLWRCWNHPQALLGSLAWEPCLGTLGTSGNGSLTNQTAIWSAGTQASTEIIGTCDPKFLPTIDGQCSLHNLHQPGLAISWLVSLCSLDCSSLEQLSK